MRSFLLVIVTVAPIVLTGTALGLVIHASRRYAAAESDLIRRLQDHSNESLEFYRQLREAEQDIDTFLENVNQDARPLIGAIELIVQTAHAMRNEHGQTMGRILRHGSDRNRANYAKELLSKIEPPPPGHPADQKWPDPEPSGNPPTPAPAPVPTRVRGFRGDNSQQRARGQ